MRIRFTRHAIERMRSRGIEEQAVLDAIRFPDSRIRKHGKLLFRKAGIEVCCETDLKVITVYWV